jgi:hypothetical protein
VIVRRLTLALVALTSVACGGADLAITPRALPSATATEEPAPTRTVRPPPTPSRTPAPTAYFVANTGGDGAILRATPGRGDRIASLPEGARVVPQGEELDVDGRRWLHVQEPAGRSGWIAQELLAVTPLPTLTPGRAPPRTPTPRR